MSSVKCVGLVSAAGAAVAGSISAYRGAKARKAVLADAQHIADANGGKIPVGGQTKDGKMVDSFTTMDNLKKDSSKTLAIGTALSTVSAAIATAAVSALTLLAKNHIK